MPTSLLALFISIPSLLVPERISIGKRGPTPSNRRAATLAEEAPETNLNRVGVDADAFFTRSQFQLLVSVRVEPC